MNWEKKGFYIDFGQIMIPLIDIPDFNLLESLAGMINNCETKGGATNAIKETGYRRSLYVGSDFIKDFGTTKESESLLLYEENDQGFRLVFD